MRVAIINKFVLFEDLADKTSFHSMFKSPIMSTLAACSSGFDEGKKEEMRKDSLPYSKQKNGKCAYICTNRCRICVCIYVCVYIYVLYMRVLSVHIYVHTCAHA